MRSADSRSQAMIDAGRIVLLYRRAASVDARGLLEVLDERYRDRKILDFDVDDDETGLEALRPLLADGDVVLVLVDSNLDDWAIEDEVAGVVGDASTLRLLVDGSRPTETELRGMLEELDARLGVSSPSAARNGAETVTDDEAPTAVDVELASDQAAALSNYPNASGLHEQPQRPPSRRRRWPWFGALIVATAVVVGVVAAVALSGTHSPTGTKPSATSTPTATSPGSSVTTGITSTAIAASPADVVARYWEAIDHHDFSTAYRYLSPGAVQQTESQWIAGENQAGIQSATFRGTTSRTSGPGATVAVGSLITRDAQFGCRSWTGSYQLVRQDGTWLIRRANISHAQCSSG